MIYPTQRAIVLAGLGVPVALVAMLGPPGAWLIGAVWVGVVLVLVLADAGLGASVRRLKLEPRLPGSLGIGAMGEAGFRAEFRGLSAPKRAEFFLDTNDRVEAAPQRIDAKVALRGAELVFPLKTTRRGAGLLQRLWVRWQGPLGLVWKQRVENLRAALPVVINVAAIKDEVLKLFLESPLLGQDIQMNIGDGAEFHALTEFQSGMNRRAIDWKQSARHGMLLAKEYREERNQQIILAIDSGRLMCEPVGGLPRIDRALRAAMLLSYVGLKLGDRVGFYAFDAVPRLSSGAVSGASAFPLLQRLAANIDYSTEETNYTLGLTQLSGELPRRSLIVIFTEFADTVSAELMIENVARLLKRHLVLFVVFRDEELEGIADREPVETDDVSRAVVADLLLREREVVIGRLRRLGVQIINARADQLDASLINTYLDLKRRDLL